MGTWIGHIAPGVFFIIFALWWHINNCIRYLKSNINEDTKPQEQTKFRGSTTYPCICSSRKNLRQIPVESILKILITSIHFSVEIITGYNPGPQPYLGDENAHHTAMLFGFFLGSWIEILVHYKVPLPKRTPQVMGLLAFAIEAFMMLFHLHARTMIDEHIHKLLGLTMFCSMIGALAECFDPNNFWFIVGRSFFALTQGTWFIQAAYVIWPQTTNPLFVWDPNSHRSITLLSMSYAYHLAGNAFVLIVMYLIVYIILSPREKFNNNNINEIDDEEISSDYKLILNTNEDENCV